MLLQYNQVKNIFQIYMTLVKISINYKNYLYSFHRKSQVSFFCFQFYAIVFKLEKRMEPPH